MKTDQKFWFRWMFNYSIGELAGIGAAATIGRFLFIGFSNASTYHTTILPLVILVVAGTCEGVIIGYVQWKSLSRLILGFKPIPWIVTTTVSAVAGWMLILPPAIVFISFLSSLKLINNYYSTLYAGLAGLAFGGIIGTPQYFIVRKFYNNALVWILANALGWMLSFLVIYFALKMFAQATSLVQNLIIITMSCALSGVLQGIITGTSLHFAMGLNAKFRIEGSSPDVLN